MLIWVAALHCEAKPVIDYYRLRKSPPGQAFDVYLGEGTACIVSGTGKLASAAACAWMAAARADEPALAWINLGTAGAAEHEIGSAFRLLKITDGDSGRHYYPVAVAGARLEAGNCLTLGQACSDYREDCLFDMEASGFMHAALFFSSAELVQAIKVVSDNRHHACGRDRPRISALIEDRMEDIAREADALACLLRARASLEPSAESWRQLLALAHFTATQKSRLRVLWRYLHNREVDSAGLLHSLAKKSSAGSIIDTLEQLSYRDSGNL